MDKIIYSVVKETVWRHGKSTYLSLLETDNQEAAMCRYTSEKLLADDDHKVYLLKSFVAGDF